METINKHESWNKGKLVGQKPPLKPKDIWESGFICRAPMPSATLQYSI